MFQGLHTVTILYILLLLIQATAQYFILGAHKALQQQDAQKALENYKIFSPMIFVAAALGLGIFIYQVAYTANTEIEFAVVNVIALMALVNNTLSLKETIDYSLENKASVGVCMAVSSSLLRFNYMLLAFNGFGSVAICYLGKGFLSYQRKKSYSRR